MTVAKKRILGLNRAFSEILTTPAGGDWAEKEAQLIESIAPLMPEASIMMRRAAVRLICHMVSDPVGLLMTMSPQHLGVISNYIYGEEVEESRLEGESMFWLFESFTEHTAGYENIVSPGMSNFFFRNDLMPMAMRAWLRLQAYHFNMAHAALVKDIWDSVWAESLKDGGVPALHRVKLIDLGVTPRFN